TDLGPAACPPCPSRGVDGLGESTLVSIIETTLVEAVQIRRARLADLEAITDIYNDAILNTTATFDAEPKSPVERLAWFQAHDERHPILVAVEDGDVAGWSSLSKWSDRRAYDHTAETSFYVKAEFRGRGIGRKL